MGVGFRELLVVAALATVGLLLAALVAFAPWYPASQTSRTPIVTVVGPDGVADDR